MEFDEQNLLEEAREQLAKVDASQDKLDKDILICECMCISVGMIRENLIDKELDVSFLTREFGLGTGCSSCLKNLEQWKGKI